MKGIKIFLFFLVFCQLQCISQFTSQIRQQYCGTTLNALTDQILPTTPGYTSNLEYWVFKFENTSTFIVYKDTTYGRTFTSLSVPLLTGGVFSLFLIHHDMYGLVAPATLIFYGLGLINASKHSYDEFSSLGYAELLLGIVASYFMGMGLLFWVIGFGLGHVILGLYLHLNYDRK